MHVCVLLRDSVRSTKTDLRCILGTFPGLDLAEHLRDVLILQQKLSLVVILEPLHSTRTYLICSQQLCIFGIFRLSNANETLGHPGQPAVSRLPHISVKSL